MFFFLFFTFLFFSSFELVHLIKAFFFDLLIFNGKNLLFFLFSLFPCICSECWLLFSFLQFLICKDKNREEKNRLTRNNNLTGDTSFKREREIWVGSWNHCSCRILICPFRSYSIFPPICINTHFLNWLSIFVRFLFIVFCNRFTRCTRRKAKRKKKKTVTRISV